MILNIKWGSIEPLLKKRFALQEENRTPIFYFESESDISVYKETERGNILCSSLSKDSIQDLVGLKQEYLADAVELIEKPKEQNTLLIKTE